MPTPIVPFDFGAGRASEGTLCRACFDEAARGGYRGRNKTLNVSCNAVVAGGVYHNLPFPTPPSLSPFHSQPHLTLPPSSPLSSGRIRQLLKFGGEGSRCIARVGAAASFPGAKPLPLLLVPLLPRLMVIPLIVSSEIVSWLFGEGGGRSGCAFVWGLGFCVLVTGITDCLFILAALVLCPSFSWELHVYVSVCGEVRLAETIGSALSPQGDKNAFASIDLKTGSFGTLSVAGSTVDGAVLAFKTLKKAQRVRRCTSAVLMGQGEEVQGRGVEYGGPHAEHICLSHPPAAAVWHGVLAEPEGSGPVGGHGCGATQGHKV